MKAQRSQSASESHLANQAGPVEQLDFITAIPQDVRRGSGCLVGIQTLRKGLEDLGCDVALIAPQFHLPLSTFEHTFFNERLRFRPFRKDAITVGFDADGYAVAGRRPQPHVACIKGVLGDILPFESRLSRANLAWRVHLEKLHAQRSDLTIVPSSYCAERLSGLYGVADAVVVPELIDLDLWRSLLAGARVRKSNRFTVLCVCRFYARKRVDLLLQAAARLKNRISELEVRIVGGGMERTRLRKLCHRMQLDNVVHWAGDVSRQQLAEEYRNADIFCLPSMQEGFGIVFLEAMAAGKAIVAFRSAAVPEVVRYGYLAEPGSFEDLAAGIERLYTDSELRAWLGEKGGHSVERFAIDRVSTMFLDAVSALR